jgi:hypothetical protein
MPERGMQEQDIPTSMARLLRPPTVAKNLSSVQHYQAGREPCRDFVALMETAQ